MGESANILRLMSWLSPVFPTGGFAYSSGLEAAVHERLVAQEQDLYEWLSALVLHGALRNDALLLGEAHALHDDDAALRETAALAAALASGAERYLETTAQGEAFTHAVKNWPELARTEFPDPCPLPVAVGIAAGHCGLSLHTTLTAYLHASVTNQVQAAIRLSVIGQSAAARLLAKLEPAISSTAAFAETGSISDLGCATVMADIIAMRHEHQSGRLFRS